jgi:transposase
VEQEAARDLVRAREDVRGDLMSARHRLSKLLLRQGIVYYQGKAWTGPHDRWWLRSQHFDLLGLKQLRHFGGWGDAMPEFPHRRLRARAAWHASRLKVPQPRASG